MATKSQWAHLSLGVYALNLVLTLCAAALFFVGRLSSFDYLWVLIGLWLGVLALTAALPFPDDTPLERVFRVCVEAIPLGSVITQTHPSLFTEIFFLGIAGCILLIGGYGLGVSSIKIEETGGFSHPILTWLLSGWRAIASLASALGLVVLYLTIFGDGVTIRGVLGGLSFLGVGAILFGLGRYQGSRSQTSPE